jgi:hypothetical protein
MIVTPTHLNVVEQRRLERLAGAARARLVADTALARPARPAPPGFVRAALAALAAVVLGIAQG